jgi:hypothetical protein
VSRALDFSKNNRAAHHPSSVHYSCISEAVISPRAIPARALRFQFTRRVRRRSNVKLRRPDFAQIRPDYGTDQEFRVTKFLIASSDFSCRLIVGFGI